MAKSPLFQAGVCGILAAVLFALHRAPLDPRAALLDDLAVLGGDAWRLTSRLQVDRRPVEAAARAALGPRGAAAIEALGRDSATFRGLVARRGDGAPRGDGAAEENRRVSDEVLVAAVRRHAEVVDADLATGLLAFAAWLGASESCEALVALGARASLAGRASPAPLNRTALHVAAARGAVRAVRAVRAPELAEARDAWGRTAADIAALQAPGDDDCGIASLDFSDLAEGGLEPYIFAGAPVVVRGEAADWATDAWAPAALATRDDFAVAPHPIPHGERSFGIPAPRGPRTLGAFVRSWAEPSSSSPPDYVFDTGAAAAILLGETDVATRLLELLRPTDRVDGLLGRHPARLHAGAARDVVQVYAGPAGAGAPFHYHEHALNVLTHGAKTWWLLPPSDAVYSVAHPATWAREPADARRCVQRAGDVLYVPANWAHAVRNDEPSVGAAFEFADAYISFSNTRRVFQY